MSEKIRAFIALEVNNEQVLRGLKKLREKFSQVEGKMKFVELENIHVTIKFLGDIELSTAEEIYDIIQKNDSIPENGFNTSIARLGVFGGNRPRVLWCGIDDEAKIIRSSQKAIDREIFNRLHIPKEKRKFSGHVTIARIRYLKNKNHFYDVINENKETVFGTQHFEKIKLKKSVLTPKGPIYSDLEF